MVCIYSVFLSCLAFLALGPGDHLLIRLHRDLGCDLGSYIDNRGLYVGRSLTIGSNLP